jgi:pyruvate,orthophosphate dikinase
MLVGMATMNGQKARKDLKVGICHKVGLGYVSCSPYRVPIARLAAAQAAISS